MTRLLPVILLLAAGPVYAQSSSAAGHWEGAIAAPMGEVQIEIDLAVDRDGTVSGTFSNLNDGLRGYPLSRATVSGRSIRLEMASNRGTEAFRGTLSEDGQTMSGEFLISVYAVPFKVTRNGEARLAAAPRNAAIDRGFEGTWHGTIAVQGQELGVVVTLANRADGTASGTWSTDGGAAVPLTITADGARLTLAWTAGSGSFSGVLDAARTGIAGTVNAGAITARVTLTRAEAQ